MFYLFMWLHWVLVMACWILVATCKNFSCSLWDLVPWLGLLPRYPALGAQRLSHWTTREVLRLSL